MLERGLNPFEIIKLYSGNATFMLMFAMSLLYLWCFEKDKVKKSVLVFPSVVMIVLFVFPLFSHLFMNKLDEEGTYYRFLWIVPTTIVSSYALFHILDRFKNKIVMIAAFVFVTVCILIGGVFMYDAPVFYKAENAYQIPSYVIDMCDDMRINDREYEAVFPDEILQYPRLYSAYIVLPYGFEMLQHGVGEHEDIHNEMVKDTIDVKTLSALCEENVVHYIVINSNKKLDGRFEDYHYDFVGDYGPYKMYRSNTLYLGNWN
ncbi:MAG: hypothetical protein J5856_00530 [Lachnospiraceae bacterium]|nr:hypothetical protein [Lachnospiraceae bacterium]